MDTYRDIHIGKYVPTVSGIGTYRVFFRLLDQVVPLPKKLQKVPHNSTVCERVEHVAFLSSGPTYNTENAYTSI
ncbi:MAG: hypothetical protein VXX82_06865 [Verrucomicrobiota bacterium]|nr:hypothetical protein [Verrucomicrobiota bacterium]